jgi:Uma2 family endonuclease
MSTLLRDPDLYTLADLQEELGGVPASRILLHPAPGTATVEDAVRLLHSADSRACELIDGTLVEKAMGMKESRVASWLNRLIGRYLDSHEIGELSGEQGGIQTRKKRIRYPDLSFFRYDSLPGGKWPKEPIPLLAPDLVVEVLSESNTLKEMELKRRDYFPAGVRIVWEIDCDERTVEVFTSPDDSTTLGIDDTLDGGDVLPGFQLPLRDLFAKLDRLG